jgi:hypothetical protein
MTKIAFTFYELASGRLIPHRNPSVSREELLELQLADEPDLGIVRGHWSSPATRFVRNGQVLDRADATEGELEALALADAAAASPPEGPVSAAEVWAARDCRLAAGFDFSFADARGVHRFGTTPDDMAGWDEVTKFAQALINSGTPDGMILILSDSGPVEVTAAEWQQVLLAAAAFRQPIWLASFALAAMEPIPADFDDDTHWT